MFAKVFGQIFDSSIAEDYNCRRMFMDLLVLADSEGVVDMTHEAIARRTNVPEAEVRKYIGDLSQPDSKSRSKLHDGKRIVPLDPNRDWGWIIVNYQHYREIRDEEARRTYFRDYQRDRRKKERLKTVKDKHLTESDKIGQKFSSASASSSASESAWIEELKADPAYKDIDVQNVYDKMIRWCKERRLRPSRMRLINWLNRQDKQLNGANQKPTSESGRGLGTANEGKSSQYASVGKVR